MAERPPEHPHERVGRLYDAPGASAVPRDPFDDGPLRFRVRTNDYVVYSIGADHKDDDGDLTSGVWPGAMRDWAPRNTRGRDIGVRVLLRTATRAKSAAR